MLICAGLGMLIEFIAYPLRKRPKLTVLSTALAFLVHRYTCQHRAVFGRRAAFPISSSTPGTSAESPRQVIVFVTPPAGPRCGHRAKPKSAPPWRRPFNEQAAPSWA